MEEAVAEAAHPPFAQGWGGGGHFVACRPFFCDSFFFTQDKGGAGPLGLLP